MRNNNLCLNDTPTPIILDDKIFFLANHSLMLQIAEHNANSVIYFLPDCLMGSNFFWIVLVHRITPLGHGGEISNA